MITFLPSKNFTVCSKALDDARLVAQVGEARIILEAILAGSQIGQPAFDMWRPYPGHLAIYGLVMCGEHAIRFSPRKERVLFIQHTPQWFYAEQIFDTRRDPPWLGDKRLHLSHIRSLFNKDPTKYAKWHDIVNHPNVQCCIGCNYWWPTHAGVM